MAKIPLDCVNEILSFLPDGGNATRQFRTEKPHIKEYLNSFFMRYTSSNLKYFNRLAKRTPASGQSPRGLRRHFIGTPEPVIVAALVREYGIAILLLEGEHIDKESACPINVGRHQCCALTTKGARCKNKTFGLFCPRHEGSTTCYWTAH